LELLIVKKHKLVILYVYMMKEMKLLEGKVRSVNKIRDNGNDLINLLTS